MTKHGGQEEIIYGRTPKYDLKHRVMYGCGEFFNGGCFVIINTFFTVFLTKALGMPAALAGTIPLIGEIWDAITDPIMGNITDRTRSRFGPKRLYIMIGSIVSALTFILLWTTIKAPSMTAMYIYYVLMFCLFSTGFTILMVPYNGLLPDMMDDYTQRARFSNMRMVWSTLGSMVCGLVPTFIIRDNKNTASYMICAVIFGVLFLITSMTVFFGSWEKHKEPVRTPVREIFPQAGSVLKSRSFRLFIGLYLFGQCGIDFISGLAVYYVDDVLNGYENGYVTYLMAVLIVSQLIGMAFFGPYMSKTSKKQTILLGAPIRLIGILGMFFFSYEGASIVPILILTALVGFGNAASLTGIFAIMADMADVDELITSIRRPGTVSGMATFIRKVSSGMSASAIGFLLAAVGYDEVAASSGLRQAAATQRGIALIFVIAPAVLTALLILCDIFFPMTGKEFMLVQREIAYRRGHGDHRASDAEKEVLRKVTGFAYEDLWNEANGTIGRRKQ